MDELRGLGIVVEADRPDFVFAKEDQAVAGGRDGGITAFGDFARSAGGRSDPNGLLDALGKTGGGRIIAMIFEIATTHEDDGTAVGGPGELGNLLTVVVAIVGEPAARVSGSVSHPHVARAMFIEDPG